MMRKWRKCGALYWAGENEGQGSMWKRREEG